MSYKEALKDRNGHILGYIEDATNGRTKITDHCGNTLGYYDPKRNVTTDKNGSKIGSGNLLTTLL